MTEIFGFDAFDPREIAERIQRVGVAKARLPMLSTCMLGLLAGAFIGLGAMGFVLIRSDASLGFAMGQVLGGSAFALGLILVVVAGAELFTGNNLLVMAWADGRIATAEMLRNWGLVLAANAVGAVAMAVAVHLSGHAQLNHGAIAEQYLRIAVAKCALPFWPAFFRGVLCNVLVCMAVWMASAGRSVTDRILAIVFPITAFVAAGFEHSIANLYLVPMAMLLKQAGATVVGHECVGWGGLLGNLVPVLLGNLVGGGILVGLVYHLIYGRPGATGASASR